MEALDKLLTARVLCGRCEREQPQQIASLFNRLRPILGGRGKEELLEFLLAGLESGMVGFHLRPGAPKLRRLPGPYPAAGVKLRCFFPPRLASRLTLFPLFV